MKAFAILAALLLLTSPVMAQKEAQKGQGSTIDYSAKARMANPPAGPAEKMEVKETAAAAIAIPCDPLHLIPNCISPSGPVSAELVDVWQKIVAVAQPDLIYAKALADAAGTPGGQLRSTCLAAVVKANEQASGANLKNADGTPMVKPNPAVVTTVEQLAELLDNLQPTAPIIAGCAAAANAAKMTVLQFLSTTLAAVAVNPLIPK